MNIPALVRCLTFVSICAFAVDCTAFGPPFRPIHQNEPASLLMYPLFDSQPATATIIDVTNTNTDREVCADNDNLMEGDVRLHYVYVGAQQADIDAGNAHWLEFDREENMTPGDTLSVLASEHNPEGEVGFLYVYAMARELEEKIVFNYLIGSAYIANANLDILWCYTPYAFQGFQESNDTDSCGHFINHEGLFFGIPYSSFPDVLYVDSFFEEKAGSFDNRLVLMSTSGQDFVNEVDFLFFNNREDRFSRTLKFVCWTSLPLSQVSAVAKDLNGDPDEFKKETGWVRIDGRRVLDLSGNPVTSGDFILGPALLGVFAQAVRVDFVAGHELHFEGSQETFIQ